MNACPDTYSVLSMTPATGRAYCTTTHSDGTTEQWSMPIVGLGVVVDALYDNYNADWRPGVSNPALYSTIVQPLVMENERHIMPLNEYLDDFAPTTHCRVVLNK